MKTEVTKQLLADAVKKLMETEPLDKVTIQDIADACRLNRKTFYNHFIDKQDLVCWVFKTEIMDVVREQAGLGLPGISRFILNALREDQAFYVNAFSAQCQNSLSGFFFNENYKIVLRIIDHYCGGRMIAAKDRAFIAWFYTYGYTYTIIGWILEGMKESPDAVERLMYYITQRGIYNMVEQCLAKADIGEDAP